MSAAFSPCRKYRYALWRYLSDDSGSFRDNCVFIGLNPSTADETKDDPTIRRCIRFARDWGCHKFTMLNLFAFRATDPKDMMKCADPVGAENDHYIRHNIIGAKIVVAAWGALGGHMGRSDQVRELSKNLHHLGLTKSGQPKHPLYLRADTKPTLWVRT